MLNLLNAYIFNTLKSVIRNSSSLTERKTNFNVLALNTQTLGQKTLIPFSSLQGYCLSRLTWEHKCMRRTARIESDFLGASSPDTFPPDPLTPRRSRA